MNRRCASRLVQIDLVVVLEAVVEMGHEPVGDLDVVLAWVAQLALAERGGHDDGVALLDVVEDPIGAEQQGRQVRRAVAHPARVHDDPGVGWQRLTVVPAA